MNPMAMMSRIILVALGLIGAFTAAAGPINVLNFSFEFPPPGGLVIGCPAGCYSIGIIPGWTGSNSRSGQFRPVSMGFTTFSDGPTVAYSDGATPISQTVLETVQAGAVYTLMVDLGARNDLPFGAGADLLIGSVIGGHRISATGVAPKPGGWSTFVATYTGLSTDVGQPITIELTFSNRQADFDNVRLSDTLAAPEPAGVVLLGLGLGALLVFARRQAIPNGTR